VSAWSILKRIAMPVALLTVAFGFAACSKVEEPRLGETVEKYLAAIKAKDADTTISLTFPPALFDQLAAQAGIHTESEKAEILEQLKAGTDEMLKQGAIVDLSINLADAETATSSTGRKYALLPGAAVLDIQGKRVKATNKYLAVTDSGRWYLIDPSSAGTIRSIKSAFPDLADVPLTEPTMEVISQ